jgi:hypothetical protein
MNQPGKVSPLKVNLANPQCSTLCSQMLAAVSNAGGRASSSTTVKNGKCKAADPQKKKIEVGRKYLEFCSLKRIPLEEVHNYFGPF